MIQIYSQNEIQDCHGKSSIQQEEDSFHYQFGLKFKEETTKGLRLEHSFCCGAETWTCRNVDQKESEIFKCGAGAGWRRSAGPIAWKIK